MGLQIIHIISTGEYKYWGVLIIYYTGHKYVLVHSELQNCNSFDFYFHAAISVPPLITKKLVNGNPPS